MFYLVIGLALIGVVVIAFSRDRVAPRPVCPNCREPLESFAVERCPHCLLWQPPDRAAPTYRWRKRQVVLGGLLVLVPGALFLLLPILIEATFAPAGTPAAAPVPAAWGAPPPLPPALRKLTPQEIATLRSLGYLPGQWGPPVPPPRGAAKKKKLSDLPPHVINALRAAGYLPANYVAPASNEKADERDAAGEDGSLDDEDGDR